MYTINIISIDGWLTKQVYIIISNHIKSCVSGRRTGKAKSCIAARFLKSIASHWASFYFNKFNGEEGKEEEGTQGNREGGRKSKTTADNNN